MVLKLGSHGNKVKAIQKVLKKFYALTVDGDFGPETEEAVRRYQHKRGIVSDGIVGPHTASFLKADGLVPAADVPISQADVSSPTIKKFIDRVNFRAGEFNGFTEVISNAKWDDPEESGWQKEVSDRLVKYMLKIRGWELGAPYCAAAEGAIITLALEDCKMPTNKFLDLWTAHVMTNVRYARSIGTLSSFPSLGSVWLAKYGSTDSGHTGIVLDIQGDNLITIEGNTVAGLKGNQRNGDGFFMRKFNKVGRGNLKTQGFISAENLLKFYVS